THHARAHARTGRGARGFRLRDHACKQEFCAVARQAGTGRLSRASVVSLAPQPGTCGQPRRRTGALGGHDVPVPVIRRAYEAGLAKFFDVYLPLANSWDLFDNSEPGRPRLVAAGEGDAVSVGETGETWRRLKENYGG